jgi:hypothetical protein
VSRRPWVSVVAVVVAWLFLILVFLLFAVTAAHSSRELREEGIRAAAVLSVNERLEAVLSHPHYDELEDFDGCERGVDGEADARRTTRVHRYVDTLPDGVVDYTTVTVEVEWPGLSHPVRRTAVVEAPGGG